MAARPRAPGAAQQPQQKRFGLIVARVAERDHVRVEVQARALEEAMPARVRRILDAIAARVGRDP